VCKLNCVFFTIFSIRTKVCFSQWAHYLFFFCQHPPKCQVLSCLRMYLHREETDALSHQEYKNYFYNFGCWELLQRNICLLFSWLSSRFPPCCFIAIQAMVHKMTSQGLSRDILTARFECHLLLKKLQTFGSCKTVNFHYFFDKILEYQFLSRLHFIEVKTLLMS